MALEDRIVIVATAEDRELLNAIMADDGDSSMSSMVRRLIRQEARRRSLTVPTVEAEQISPDATQPII